MKDLRKKDIDGTLNAEEHVSYGLLAERFEGIPTAILIFAKAQSLHNTYAPALFHYGRALLEQQNQKGIEYINQAMDRDWDSIIPGARMVYQYLVGIGKKEEADGYYNNAAQRWEEIELAREERATLKPDSTFIEHELSEDEVCTLVDQLKAFPDITMLIWLE